MTLIIRIILRTGTERLRRVSGAGSARAYVLSLEAEGIRQIKLIDATPIGINVRSTVATYANVHDELRKIYARTPDGKKAGYKAGDFSYNTGKLRCPLCDGTGVISLDVSQAIEVCRDMKIVRKRLEVLKELGLGYLTLREETPSLSGGEAQRLKLASEMRKGQSDSVFVFDEPTIGLHPLDVIRNGDYIIDMGPGGEEGGRIIASGTPDEVARDEKSITGRYLAI